MFYEPGNGHGLPYDPFNAIVSPRPIGWISTVDETGRPNLAPYSFFNAISSSPPMLVFSSEGMKDTPRNVQQTGEFVFNLATATLAGAMNASAAPLAYGDNEFAAAELGMVPSRLVRPPRVLGSPAALECRMVYFCELKDLTGAPTDRFMVIGQVVGVHIEETYLVDGRFDVVLAGNLARCGYRDYSTLERLFELVRPTEQP